MVLAEGPDPVGCTGLLESPWGSCRDYSVRTDLITDIGNLSLRVGPKCSGSSMVGLFVIIYVPSDLPDQCGQFKETSSIVVMKWFANVRFTNHFGCGDF